MMVSGESSKPVEPRQGEPRQQSKAWILTIRGYWGALGLIGKIWLLLSRF